MHHFRKALIAGTGDKRGDPSNRSATGSFSGLNIPRGMAHQALTCDETPHWPGSRHSKNDCSVIFLQVKKGLLVKSNCESYSEDCSQFNFLLILPLRDLSVYLAIIDHVTYVFCDPCSTAGLFHHLRNNSACPSAKLGPAIRHLSE